MNIDIIDYVKIETKGFIHKYICVKFYNTFNTYTRILKQQEIKDVAYCKTMPIYSYSISNHIKQTPLKLIYSTGIRSTWGSILSRKRIPKDVLFTNILSDIEFNKKEIQYIELLRSLTGSCFHEEYFKDKAYRSYCFYRLGQEVNNERMLNNAIREDNAHGIMFTVSPEKNVCSVYKINVSLHAVGKYSDGADKYCPSNNYKQCIDTFDCSTEFEVHLAYALILRNDDYWCNSVLTQSIFYKKETRFLYSLVERHWFRFNADDEFCLLPEKEFQKIKYDPEWEKQIQEISIQNNLDEEQQAINIFNQIEF